MEIIVNELAEAYHMQVEGYIKCQIQPKPKWLPNFIWKKLLSRLLVLNIPSGITIGNEPFKIGISGTGKNQNNNRGVGI